MLDEFRETKNALIVKKQIFTEQLAVLEQDASKRFEPAIRFINGLKQATLAHAGENLVSHRDIFKKTGSNSFLRD